MAETPAEAYRLALACDPQSAFGGVVAVNREIDEKTCSAIVAGPQADVIIARGYTSGARERIHAKRAATRLLEAPVEADRAGMGSGAAAAPSWRLEQLGDEFLLQDVGVRAAADPGAWRVVTARQPTPEERDDAIFAWLVCAATVSNAVVLAQDGVAWGIGAGQQNRADAGRSAALKAVGRAAGGACASDGFYPFVDGIEAAAEAGVSVVVQPGGSINDDKVIAAADSAGLAMLFTGRRRFRH